MIGGGIAGLAAAWQLSDLGVRDVLLLEAEPMLATHASGRNAAIFLPLEESRYAVWLAARSRDILDSQLGTSWLSAQGVVLASQEADALDELRYTARNLEVFHTSMSAAQLHARVPLLREGPLEHAIHLPLGGVVDVHHILTAIRRMALAGGVRIRTQARVQEIHVAQKRVTGVTLVGGAHIESERVVVAAGTYAGPLGKQAGAELALMPLRRHLVHLVGDNLPRWKSPVVWRVDDQVYFRPEAGGILASPCDETPWEPGIPPTSPEALDTLADKLTNLSRALGAARVQRAWACSRTITADREPVIGADPRVRGLLWLAGLGGRGITCGVAAAEALARDAVGLPHPFARTLSVERLLS